MNPAQTRAPQALLGAGCLTRGFTLIEVLVALAIVALGSSAMMVALTTATDSTTHLRDRQFAEWIALNRLAETRLTRATPEAGRSAGELEYAGKRWRWEQEIAAAELSDLWQITVRVAPLDDDDWFDVRGYWGERITRPPGRERLWNTAGRSEP